MAIRCFVANAASGDISAYALDRRGDLHAMRTVVPNGSSCGEEEAASPANPMATAPSSVMSPGASVPAAAGVQVIAGSREWEPRANLLASRGNPAEPLALRRPPRIRAVLAQCSPIAKR
jgi:hypothetical protein